MAVTLEEQGFPDEFKRGSLLRNKERGHGSFVCVMWGLIISMIRSGRKVFCESAWFGV